MPNKKPPLDGEKEKRMEKDTGRFFFRTGHSGAEWMVEVVDCPLGEIETVLTRLASLVKCGCCLPAFRGDNWRGDIDPMLPTQDRETIFWSKT